MTKIKNFRITLRAREVIRALKAQEGEVFDSAWDVEVEPALALLKPFVKPASIYATLTHSTASKATPLELPSKAVALSIVIATIGPDLANERVTAEAEGDARRVRLIAATEKEALSQSMAFALRLIQSQAKEEDCELSEPFVCQEVDTLHRLASLLGIERIGLNADAHPIELPPYARLVYVIWMPIGKKSSKTRREKAPV